MISILMMRVKLTTTIIRTRSCHWPFANEDRQSKFTTSSVKRPNGENSIGYLEWSSSFLVATGSQFRFTMWYAKHWACQCGNMQRTTISRRMTSMFSESSKFVSCAIRKMKFHGSSSRPRPQSTLMQARLPLASTKYSTAQIAQLLVLQFTRSTQRKCPCISTRFSAFASRINYSIQTSPWNCLSFSTLIQLLRMMKHAMTSRRSSWLTISSHRPIRLLLKSCNKKSKNIRLRSASSLWRRNSWWIKASME